MSLEKKMHQMSQAVIKADQERRATNLWLAAIVKKFGGSIVITKRDTEGITDATAIMADKNELNGEVRFTLGVNPDMAGKMRGTHGN